MCWKSSMSCHRHLNIKYLHVWKSETNWLTYYISFFAFKIRLWTISLWVGILDAHIFPHDTCAIKDFGGAAFLEFSTQKAGFLDVGNIVSWFRCWYPGMYSICVNSLSLLLFSFLVVSDSLWPHGAPLLLCPGGYSKKELPELVSMPCSRGSFQLRDQTQVTRIASGFFTIWATKEAQETGVGSLSLLLGIFQTHELNQGSLHCRQILYLLTYQGSPVLNLKSCLILS